VRVEIRMPARAAETRRFVEMGTLRCSQNERRRPSPQRMTAFVQEFAVSSTTPS
jgi:hypothetical protein